MSTNAFDPDTLAMPNPADLRRAIEAMILYRREDASGVAMVMREAGDRLSFLVAAVLFLANQAYDQAAAEHNFDVSRTCATSRPRWHAPRTMSATIDRCDMTEPLSWCKSPPTAPAPATRCAARIAGADTGCGGSPDISRHRASHTPGTSSNPSWP